VLFFFYDLSCIFKAYGQVSANANENMYICSKCLSPRPPLNRTPNNERNANTKNSHTPLITTRGGRPYRLTTKRTTLICSFVPNNTSKKNIGVLSCCELGFQPKPKRSIRRCIGSLRSKIHKPRYGPVHKEYTTQAMDLFSRTSKPKEKHENKKRWCISVSFERS
jgi:hypothetical protein